MLKLNLKIFKRQMVLVKIQGKNIYKKKATKKRNDLRLPGFLIN